MAFIGNTPTTQGFIPAVDFFSGNGSTTAFTLSRPVASVAQVQVVVENVPQMPGDAYTVSGNTITFTSAPASGTNNIYVYYTSPITQVIAPSQGTVGTAALAPGLDVTAGLLSVAGNNISAVNSLGFRNRLINGGMVIDQRNAGASVSPGASALTYTIDRWGFYNSTANNRFSVQRNAGNVARPSGFTNYLGFTVTSAYTPSGTDQQIFSQQIEGFNVSDLAWGTAAAQSVTVSFWAYSSLTGTHSGAIRNPNGYSRSYPFTFTVSAANTWEQKTVTIPGDTGGTWNTDNNSGMQLAFNLGSGSSSLGTAGVWNTTNAFTGATGSVQVSATNGATFYITGVQLEAGTVASPFERRDYGRELIMCQRYFEKSFDANTAPAHNTGPFLIVPNGGSAGCGGNTYTTMFYKVSKRSSSTIRIYDPFGAAAATTNAFRSYTACNSGSQSTGYFPDGQTTEWFAGTFQAATNGSIGFLWTADSEL